MRRLLFAALALGLVFALPAAPAPGAAAEILAGNWKVVVLENIQEIPIWIVEINKEGKSVSVLDGIGPFKTAKVEGFSSEDGVVRFSLQARGTTFEVSVPLGKGKEKPKTLLGSLEFGPGRSLPARLESTEEKALDPKGDAPKQTDGADDFKAAMKDKDEERQKGLEAITTKFSGKPIALVAYRALIQDKAAKGEIKVLEPTLKGYFQESAKYGRVVERTALDNVARLLLANEKLAGEAVEYARRAEGLVRKTDPAASQVSALNLLAKALRKVGKEDEAKKLDGQVAKLEEKLDEEFEKKAVPFKTEPFKGRKGKSNRVAVVELFTGAQCPPCVAADIAFDAGVKTYTPKEAVFLQYHLHIPGPDPLTSPASEARQKYYGDKIEGTPTAFIDGAVSEEGLGGFTANGKQSFENLAKQLDADLEQEPGAEIKLKVESKGDDVDLTAEVSGLKKTGEKVRLRFVLVQDVVKYAGGNGQRLHHHVVRALPGGAEGFALEKANSSHKAKVSLAEVRKSLEKYLSDFEAKRKGFTWDKQPLELKGLKIVAFVQDDEDKKILQGAQADVPLGRVE